MFEYYNIVRKIQFTQYVALTVKQIIYEFYTMFHFFCKKTDLPSTFTSSLYHIGCLKKSYQELILIFTIIDINDLTT